MKHIITAKGTTVTDGIKAYVEKKFSKFDKYVSEDITVHTKIEVKDNGNRHKVEVTIPFGKQLVRAEINDTDMYAAIDSAEKTIVRLLRKKKEKMIQRHRQPNITETATDEDMNDEKYEIAKSKVHQMQILSAQEACEAMEMVGHPFYVYRDVDCSENICAVYVREDGTYGHILFE